MADPRAPRPVQTSSSATAATAWTSDPHSFLPTAPDSNLTRPVDAPASQSPIDPTDSSSTHAVASTRNTTPRTPFTPSTSASNHSQPSHLHLPPAPNPTTAATSTATATAMTLEDSARAAKVAIPRLKRSLDTTDPALKPGGRHRVTHACEPCRHRKTKCSGDRPACRHCQDFKIQCYYADGKRDRVKKQFGSMTEKVTDYERILRELQTRVSDDDAALIRSSLDRAALLDGDDLPHESASIMPLEDDATSDVSGDECHVSGRAGSTGALDTTSEDFTRQGARATGFMGKNSEITWLQRLHVENRHGDSTALYSPGPPGDEDTPILEADGGMAVQDLSYHLNDLSIAPFEAVDPFEMPTQEHARKLFSTYMTRVHPTFPVVGRINLENQFAKFLARPMNRPPPKWLAIINMIFAIAAKLSHLVLADWQADERDHLIYFTRARLLSIDTDTLFNHPDLQTIQIYGLMSFYLLAIEQINRSWSLVGVAIRHATSLGLNMRNESPDLTDGLKEIRYRVWWAIYTLENRLCAMTGRVSCILDEHCTTPLPAPVQEEDFDSDSGRRMLSADHQRSSRVPSPNSQTPLSFENPTTFRAGSKEEKMTSRSPSQSVNPLGELDWARDVVPNSSLFFLHLVQLCRITQSCFQLLYNPAAVHSRWSDLQTGMQSLNLRVENWYRALPAAFDFGRKQRDRELYEPRLALGFSYYAARQIINRPCLCRLDQKIPNQSNKSHEFNHASAIACVTAALEQLQLIPDEPNGVGLLRVGPWMLMVHFLVQSATVLMLEISFRAHHMPDRVDELLTSAKKAVRWLHALADEDLAAARAWKLCNSMLAEAARKIGGTTDDMPRRTPKSYDSQNGEMSISGPSSVYDAIGTQSSGSHDPNHSFSQQPHMMHSMPSTHWQGYGNFTAFDQPRPYESFSPATGTGVDSMQGPPSDMRFSADNMAMNYMNTYLGQNSGLGDASRDPTGRRGGGTGGMSGFG